MLDVTKRVRDSSGVQVAATPCKGIVREEAMVPVKPPSPEKPGVLSPRNLMPDLMTAENAETLVDHVEAQGLVEQTTAEPGVAEQGKGPKQTAAEPEQGKGPVEQTTAEPAAGVEQGEGPKQTAAEPAAGVEPFRSLDSMTTLSWGRSLSNIRDVIGETPMKQQATFEESVMELGNQLVRAFADGASKDDPNERKALCDIVMDWVLEAENVEFTHMQGTAEMCLPASDCLEAYAAIKDVALKVATLKEQLAAKMAHAEQAVAKALASVVQHAGQAKSMSSSSAVTQRMASWKKSLQEEGMKDIQLASDQQQICVQRLEKAVQQVLETAFGQYDRDRPKSEDELVQQMLKEVEIHMSALQLTGVDASSGGGTGFMGL
ncbi:unnamed protein product [Symbiodinium necroappetens]|uniref:Uncharacterized protein n=1 Tax=Symbiodinium necroappetens TaxID=1628268 RepID=A0A812YV14_9DINO|nr:unnamed protein product [Symbiodinium necroappetens]